ncbi:MAG: hypothetical protein ACFFDH_06255 [Promethearchaeota archaeon]
MAKEFNILRIRSEMEIDPFGKTLLNRRKRKSIAYSLKDSQLIPILTKETKEILRIRSDH